MPLCTYVNNCCAVRRVWCRTRAGLEARWTRLSRWAALWCTPASSTEARQGPLPPLPHKNPPMLIYSHITKLRLVLIIGVVDMRCSFVFCFIHFICLLFFVTIMFFFTVYSLLVPPSSYYLPTKELNNIMFCTLSPFIKITIFINDNWSSLIKWKITLL